MISPALCASLGCGCCGCGGFGVGVVICGIVAAVPGGIDRPNAAFVTSFNFLFELILSP